MTFTSRIYGLGVAVNVPVAGLAGLAPAEHIDVRICLRPGNWSGRPEPQPGTATCHISSGMDEAGQPNLVISRHAETADFHLAYSDGTHAVIDAAGTRIDVAWPAGGTVEDAATYLLGPLLGFVLRLRGVTCLHASAVVIDGCAVALVGSAGAGKSSTAAAFAAGGFAVLSDDVVAVRQQGGQWLVQPAYPRIRLWPAAAAALFGSADALERITPTWEKRFVNLNDPRYKFQREALPLGAVYFLGETDTALSATAVEGLDQRTALMTLVADTYATRLLDRDQRAREFAELAALVGAVSLRQLHRCDDVQRLTELRDTIVADMRRPTGPLARNAAAEAATGV